MKLIVIIPAYNEEKTIKEAISKIPKFNDRIDKTEVIVIDDGSIDRTKEIAEEAGAVVISHFSNKGVGVAFKTGIEEALKRKADIIVNVDADGQFNPKDIPKLLFKMEKGYVKLGHEVSVISLQSRQKVLNSINKILISIKNGL